MLKSLKKTLTVAAILCALCTSTYAAELSSWAVSDFINANEERLIPMSVGVAAMNGYITREQFCELLVNTYEKATGKKLEYTENPFTDCENPAVINAYGAGIISGKSETLFAPYELVTRESMAKMLHNVMVTDNVSVKFPIINVMEINAYEDIADVSAWAMPAMSAVISCSLMGGTDGKILPKDNVTCEQAIVAASRLYDFFAGKHEEIEMKEESQEFVVIEPAENGKLVDTDVLVSWNATPDAVSYNVLVRNADGELLVNENTTETFYTIGKDNFSTGEYNVSIQANFENGDVIFCVPTGFLYEMPVVEAAVSNASNSQIEAIFAEAEKYIGTPYRYGGTSPAGFDCSGYVQYVFKNNGITLKRTSRDQYAGNGVAIQKSELKRGDLVFFGSGGRVNHVGIYAGDGTMIHSPSTGKTVTYTSIETDYYKSHYIGAKRIFN